MKKYLASICLVAGMAVCGLELNPKLDPVSVMGYRQKAEAGDAEATYLLSQALANGLGCEMDESKAMQYAIEAAKRGMGLAWRTVGLGYENGWEGEKDVKKAAQCYAKFLEYARPLAENGDAWSQCQLGKCYYFGNGVEKNYAEAVKWYRKAAEQGQSDAQNNLGGLYAEGEGVEKDNAEAVNWYRKAAEQGHAAAQFNLGLLYARGEGVEKNDVEAVKWYRKSAEQGVVMAQDNLRKYYADETETGTLDKKGEGDFLSHLYCSLHCPFDAAVHVTTNLVEELYQYMKSVTNGTEGFWAGVITIIIVLVVSVISIILMCSGLHEGCASVSLFSLFGGMVYTYVGGPLGWMLAERHDDFFALCAIFLLCCGIYCMVSRTIKEGVWWHLLIHLLVFLGSFVIGMLLSGAIICFIVPLGIALGVLVGLGILGAILNATGTNTDDDDDEIIVIKKKQ